LDGDRIEKSNFALTATQDSSTTGPTSIHVRNSVVTGNSNNISAFTTNGMGTTAITLDRSSSTLSSGDGITSSGSHSFVLLGRSSVISNSVGLNADNGQIFSYKNNHLSGNATDGAPTSVLSLK
jgi:hypothetical protein